MVFTASLQHILPADAFGVWHVMKVTRKTTRTYLGHQVALSSEHFHLEIPVRAVNNAGFIHHTGDSWILVNYNLA